MAEHIINFIEGAGIAILASDNGETDPSLGAWNVEIANLIYGLLLELGDLITVDMDGNPARLAAGTDGQVLTASSAAPAGLAWATGGAGGDPAADTAVWMPLIDSDGTAVLDTGGGVIPTLIPI